MKILHTADWHLGKRLEHFERFNEQSEVLKEICAIAEREAVDAVIIAGDIFDVFNPPTEATELFYKTVHRLSRNGNCAVIAIAGNHDSPDRIEAPHPLANVSGIFLAGYPNSIISRVQLDSGLEVTRSAPGFMELKLPGIEFPLRLLLTPYANELRLRKCLEDSGGDELREVLQEHWQQLADQFCDDRGVNVLLAHLFFTSKDGPVAAEPEDEKPILHIGGAQAIYTENIPAQIQYAALGHLHRYQVVTDNPCPVVYSSSILEYSFSEVYQTKYVAIVDLVPGQKAKFEKVPLQAGRKLIRKRFESPAEAIQWLKESPDYLVELTLVSDDYIKAGDLRDIYSAHDGIIHIIPEIHNTNLNEQKAHKVDLSQDIEALFRQYFVSRHQQEPNEEMMDLFRAVTGHTMEND